MQSVEGYLFSGGFNHSGPLRVLVATKPESEALTRAIRYWLEHWKDVSSRPSDIAIGILALTELDYEKYS
ncbi:MAG: hypothetical protein ACTSP1_15870, partial [Candidatus Freyarchaeota archaeon]